MMNELTREGWPLSLQEDGRRYPFIVIEGGDGAGTTTQVNLLVDRMNRLNYPVGATAEPTRGPIGKLIRQMLAGAVGPWHWRVQLHLFQADRGVHVAERIWPMLTSETGAAVICDRYVYSTAVYQGIGAARTEDGDSDVLGYFRKKLCAAICIPPQYLGGTEVTNRASSVDWVNGWVTEILDDIIEESTWVFPDIAILVDVDDKVAMDRRAARSGTVEIFDAEFFQKEVLHQYRQLWGMLAREANIGKRYYVVDGNAPPEKIADAIWDIVQPLIVEIKR
jgi:thymidylate kinase